MKQFELTQKLRALVLFSGKHLHLANSAEKREISRALSDMDRTGMISSTEVLSVYSVIIKKLKDALASELQRTYFGFDVPSLNSLVRNERKSFQKHKRPK